MGSYCFKDCYNLKTITIPNSLEYAYYSAFEGCKNLTIYGSISICEIFSRDYSYIKTVVTETIKPPTFTVQGVIGGRNVIFDCEKDGATIYYTTAGTSTLKTTDPNVSPGESVIFNAYYGTIYARTYYKGNWSVPARLILKIPTVNTPTITKSSNGKTKIKTTTPNALVYYTTDGSRPSETNYSGKFWCSRDIKVAKGTTIKAVAVRSCFSNSSVTSQTVTW
jgi:hypothetical protein